MMQLLLLRHGESTWNAHRLWQGQADPPLSSRGMRQAEASRVAVAAGAPDAAVCSDLRRAVATARLATGGLDLEIVQDVAWREWDVGAWSGLTREEIRDRWPRELAAVRAGDLDLAAPGGESRREFEARVVAAADRLASEHPEGRVLVVTHRGVIRALTPGRRAAHADLYSATWPPPTSIASSGET